MNGSLVVESQGNGTITAIFATDVEDAERLHKVLQNCFIGGVKKVDQFGSYLTQFTPSKKTVSQTELQDCLRIQLHDIINPDNISFTPEIIASELEIAKKLVISAHTEKTDVLQELKESIAHQPQLSDLNDKATQESLTREKELSISRLQMDLRGINAAIERISNGLYGICTICKEDIEEKRLLTVPWTPFCVDCSSESELQNKKPGKK